MARSLWAELAKLADEERRAAAEWLLKRDLDRATHAAAVAEAASKLLVDVHARRDRRWAVATGTACLLAAAVLWSAPTPANNVVIEIEADAVELRPVGQPLGTGRLRSTGSVLLAEMEHIRSPVGRCTAPGEQTCFAELSADPVSLTELRVPTDGTLTLERPDSGTLVFYFRGTGAGGFLSVTGDSDMAVGVLDGQEVAGRRTFEVPEPVEFHSSSAVIGARLEFPTLDTLWLRQMVVRELSFTRESATDASHPFRSTILEGRVVFPSAEDTVQLTAGEGLRLSGVHGRVEVLAGPELTLRFEGRVGRVRVGPEGFTRDVTPRLLETFYHSQPFTFLFSTIAVLWGVLWSARKILFPQSSASSG